MENVVRVRIDFRAVEPLPPGLLFTMRMDRTTDEPAIFNGWK